MVSLAHPPASIEFNRLGICLCLGLITVINLQTFPSFLLFCTGSFCRQGNKVDTEKKDPELTDYFSVPLRKGSPPELFHQPAKYAESLIHDCPGSCCPVSASKSGKKIMI